MAAKANFLKGIIAKPSAIGFAYARYSSHNQKEESIEQQLSEIQKYASENNIEIVEIFSDAAMTGKTDRRPQFQRMLREAKKRLPDVIVAYKSNRVFRNMLHALTTESEMEKIGIRVLYAKEEFGNNAAGRFALRTMMNVNQFYSENMAEDIQRGMMDNAINCKSTGHIPFGYRTNDEGYLELDEDAAAVVREIYGRVACGDTCADISADLNAREIKTRVGNQWNKNSFHVLLHNERYTGVYIYKDVRVEGGIPQIIGKELFYTVQEKLKNKPNPQGRHRVCGDYMLTGKLYCGKCKSHMVGLSGTGKSGGLHYYYACQKKRIEKDCDKKNAPRDWLEHNVAYAIRKHVLQPDVIEWISSSVESYEKKHREDSEIDMLEARLAEIKKSSKNLLIAIEQGIITTTTKERLLELESEQSRINGRLAIEKSEIPEVSKEQVVAWLESFQTGDIEDKAYQAKLFNTFLVAVYLYDDYLKIEFSFSGKQNTIRMNLDPDVIDNIGKSDGGECSYKVPLAPPTVKKACKHACLQAFLLWVVTQLSERRERNKQPPAMRVSNGGYTKKSPYELQ